MLKVAVFGGGSTYTPELVNGFLERINSFPITELWLMDIDAARLDIVGGFAQRMVEAKGSPFKVISDNRPATGCTGRCLRHHPASSGTDASQGQG